MQSTWQPVSKHAHIAYGVQKAMGLLTKHWVDIQPYSTTGHPHVRK